MTLADYFVIILALPEEALKRLIDKYNAGEIKNPKTVMALEIIDGLAMED